MSESTGTSTNHSLLHSQCKDEGSVQWQCSNEWSSCMPLSLKSLLVFSHPYNYTLFASFVHHHIFITFCVFFLGKHTIYGNIYTATAYSYQEKT